MKHPPYFMATVGTLAVAVAAALSATPALAATGPITSTSPATFGASWDSPRTSEAPVVVPSTPRCSVTLVQHAFTNYDVYTAPYVAPTCGSKGYAKAVLRLDGAVKGRQFDRLGWLDVNGVRLLTTSTPEPSAEGITWHTEKDVTDELPALLTGGTTQMYLGNTVDSTYTGVLDITVTIDFYAAQGNVKAADTADAVVPLAAPTRQNGDLVGSATLPASTERVTADVYATGSGGGCEEFWDTSAPASTGYSCADGLPYREVDVLIDGKLAGVALPVAYVYTGGWSNPYLWYTIPSPGAFNIPALHYDLTPFVGVLHDGAAHEVRIKVAGGPTSGDGWTLSAHLHVWKDKLGRALPAALVSTSAAPAVVTSQVTGQNDSAGSVTMNATRHFEATGWVDTPTGRVTTTVARDLANASLHTWTDGEMRDDLKATWSDHQVVTSQEKNHKPSVSDTALAWDKQGYIELVPHAGIAGAYDLTTSLTIGIRENRTVTVRGKQTDAFDSDNRFTGSATWLYGVPREQRTASAHTEQTYTQHGGGYASYTHRLVSVNGRFTVDAEQAT